MISDLQKEMSMSTENTKAMESQPGPGKPTVNPRLR